MTEMIRMKRLDLVQGSEAWDIHRATAKNASEAAAMLNECPYMNRDQLLDAKKGWIQNPIGYFKESIFQDGHEAEDRARVIFENEMFEDYPPIVAVRTVQGVELSASFDCCNETDDSMEHKQYNNTLAENVRNGVLERRFLIQLEQQCMVSNKKQITFRCSDGGDINTATMIYHSSPELQEEILAGWEQFDIDLAKHKIKAKVEPIKAAEIESLPVITWSTEGTDVMTNAQAALEKMRTRAEIEIKRELVTDLDFANKETLIKNIATARARLKDEREAIKYRFLSYSEQDALLAELDGLYLQMHSHGKKQIDSEKAKRKEDLCNTGIEAINSRLGECNDTISPLTLSRLYPTKFFPAFSAAIKGKRDVGKMEAAINAEVARVNIEITAAMEVVEPNLAYLKDHASDYKNLFGDINTLIVKDPEACKIIIDQRIESHKENIKIEADRIGKERLAKIEADQAETGSPTTAFIGEPTVERVVHTETIEGARPIHNVDAVLTMPEPTQSREDLLISSLSQWAKDNGTSGKAMTDLINIIETHTILKED